MKSKITTVIMVLLVIAILVLAYFVFVGQDKKVPNIGVSSDPTGEDRGPIAYAVITTSVGLKNEYNRFDGKVYSVNVDLHSYIVGQPAQTYREKWDLTSLGFLQDDVKIWVEMVITGPNNYISDVWTSEKQTDNIPEVKMDYNHYNFGPYRADFWDSGEYAVKVTLHVSSDEYTGSPATKTQLFTVTG
jgi:hypothetical protein